MTTLAILLSALGIFYCGYLYRTDRSCSDLEPRATRLLDGERFVPPGRISRDPLRPQLCRVTYHMGATRKRHPRTSKGRPAAGTLSHE